VLEYLTQNTGKLYHHKMKMVKLQPETPTPHAIEYLKKKHYQFFMGGKISDNQLQGIPKRYWVGLIDKMKARLKALKGHSK
jgi:centrosomal protein CEP19